MIFLAGLIMAFNLLIILHKIRKCRLLNALIDFILLWIVFIVTVGTYSGLAMGMIASLTISIYLWFFPIKEPYNCDEFKELYEILEKDNDAKSQ